VYAHDDEISWVHWDAADHPLTEFTSALVKLRSEHPTFRRSRFFDGRPVEREEGAPLPDIAWLRPDGTLMSPADWDAGFGKSIGVFLNGQGIAGRDARGEEITDDSFLLFFNAHDQPVDFTIPSDEQSPEWEIVVDTAGASGGERHAAGDTIAVVGRSLLVLCAEAAPEPETDHSVSASLSALAAATPSAPPAPSAKATS
jgi:glycogen operon protein